SGCCPSPRSSVPRRTCPSRGRTQRSARSPTTRTVWRWSRSTPSRCGPRSGSVAEEEHGPEAISAEELLRQLRAADLLLGTVASLVQVATARLAEGETGEARLAIEALRALGPVLRESLPADATRDLDQAVANLQLAFASAVAGAKEKEQEPGTED